MNIDDSLTNNNIRGRVLFLDPASLYLAKIVQNLNYEAKVVIGEIAQNLQDIILKFEPDYLVGNITFENYIKKMELLAKIKNCFPTLKIIVTGEPFLTYNTNVTYENPYINYVITGEPEYTLRDILDGVPDSEILGISYTDENMQAVKNEPRPFIENLDELPCPDSGTGIIELSRGCEHNCFFCIENIMQGNIRRCRSVQSVISELKNNIKNKIRTFVFKSNDFNSDREWVIDLCNKIIENKLSIKWSTNVIPHKIDNKLAQVMRKAGCESCNLGIESGDASILKNIGKNITLDEIKNTVKILRKNKIKTTGFFLIGLPWETEETAKETIKFSSELKLDDAVFNIAVPFPGTKFFVYSMLNKLTGRELNFENSFKNAPAKTHKLSRERIVELKTMAERNFYTRPQYVFKTLLNFDFKSFGKIMKIIFNR